MPGSGGAQASQKSPKGRPYEDKNSQKIPIYGAAQELTKSNHDGGGQETRTVGTTPLRTRRYRDRGWGVSRNGGGRT